MNSQYGSACFLGPHEPKRAHTGPYELLWAFMGPSGPICAFMDHHGPVQQRIFVCRIHVFLIWVGYVNNALSALEQRGLLDMRGSRNVGRGRVKLQPSLAKVSLCLARARYPWRGARTKREAPQRDHREICLLIPINLQANIDY